MIPKTLVDIFYGVIDRNSPRIMQYKRAGEWHSVSSSDLYKYVVGTAQALSSWGVGKGDRVAILSENRPEWAVADYATLLLGAVVVPIYSTLTAEQTSYLLRNSGARVLFVSTQAQLEKIAAARNGSDVEHVVVMDDGAPPDVAGMAPIMAAGPKTRDHEFDLAAKTISADELATLIYTSGTTGTPKGAMLTHGNIASNISVSLDGFAEMQDETAISFLPLSHITARHVDYALAYHGVTLAYCSFFDELPVVLQEIRPTIFLGVPRVYEKMYNKVLRDVEKGLKKKVYEWALGVGQAHREQIVRGETPTSKSWKLANRLLFSKIRQAIGGRVTLFISGGAPLGRELCEWFANMGIVINEGYGLTETSPVIAVNTPSAFKLGTVGKPLSNVEVKIAYDGEILVRAPSVFKGYWNMEEETANAFEGEFFKTGDIGQIDEDGFLSVTDRKKDLIKTSGGKFIAPQPIESSLKANMHVGEAAIVGDRKRFPGVVIVPNFPVLEEWAKQKGIVFTSREQLIENPEVQALYQEIISDINQNLAQYEKLKKFVLLSEEFTVASGTLTPTMKLRRRAIEERYRAVIERMYKDAMNETAGVR